MDIYNAFKACFLELKLPFRKFVSITTYGQKAMVGRVNSFISLCQKDDDFQHFLKYKCIIYQQVLSSQRPDTKRGITVKIANLIKAKTERRLFRQEFEGQKLLLYTDFRWLSKNKFLKDFEIFSRHHTGCS